MFESSAFEEGDRVEGAWGRRGFFGGLFEGVGVVEGGDGECWSL